jgi:hypothetical protein
MNENQNAAGENIPGKEKETVPSAVSPPVSDNTVSPAITPSSTSQPEQQMEVHHHGHVHHKTKWKEYIFQFIMLFLAVFLGFMAENWRERGVEKDMEKEYMESLLVDLKEDYTRIGEANDIVSEQIKNIDSLQDLLSSDLDNNQAAVFKTYYFSSAIQFYANINFNERTITQLLSSGNMRLLKTQGVADSVMEYFNTVKNVEVQKKMYVDFINKCLESMYDVYDISYLRKKITDDSITYVNPDWTHVRLLTTNPAELRKMVAMLETTKIVIYNYLVQLNYLRTQADATLKFIRKEYHFEHE